MVDDVQKLALETIQKRKQAIIFVPSRASAEKTALDISKLTHFYYHEFEKDILSAASSPTKQCQKLAKVIKKGVAFHHAGLLQKQKDLIEEEFKSGKIKIICCTPTLAAGLSLPVFRVIIKSLKRFSGQWGMDWIPVLEYLQMAGRAGRPEYEDFGESIVLAKDENAKEEIYERYVCGQPEDIYSKLAVEPVLRTYLLSLISSGIIRDEKAMKDFFAKTFWAQQYQDLAKLEFIMDKMLSLLKKWKFVDLETENEDSDFVVATNLNKKSTAKTLRPTLLGKRISELYLDPLTAQHILTCIKNYDQTKNNFSLLQLVSHTLEMRPLLRVRSREQEIIQEELVKNHDFLLETEPYPTDLEYHEFMNSIKTTLFFADWIEEKNEDFLLDKYNIRPGEIRVKLENADWLLYATQELARILLVDQETIKDISRLRIRVKNGVKEDLLTLLKLKGVGRVRARKLATNGIKDFKSLKSVDLSSLSQIVGRALAEKIKIQLGEEIKIVPKGTRKGQLSLSKF